MDRLGKATVHPHLRRTAIVAATVAAKLLVSLTMVIVGLELGTRLLMPEQRFELIPNTFDPVCRIRQEPDATGFVRCPEYAMEIHTNADGLREDRRYAATATAARVLCLGDSFTCGLGVPAHETFAKVADRALGADIDVINAGVVATGTAEQLAWYELAGHDYRTDVVVLAFCVNDWTDNTKGGLFTFAADSSLVQHPATEDRSLRWLRKLRALPGYDTWFARSHFLNRFKQWYAQRHHGRLVREAISVEATDEVWHRERALAEGLLTRLRDACERDGTALLVMPVPAVPSSGDAVRRQAELAAFLAREDFAWLDLRPDVDLKTDTIADLYYPVDGHWTAAGHALAGRRLAEYLAGLRTHR